MMRLQWVEKLIPGLQQKSGKEFVALTAPPLAKLPRLGLPLGKGAAAEPSPEIKAVPEARLDSPLDDIFPVSVSSFFANDSQYQEMHKARRARPRFQTARYMTPAQPLQSTPHVVEPKLERERLPQRIGPEPEDESTLLRRSTHRSVSQNINQLVQRYFSQPAC
jgi:hypothetical protein